MKALNLALHIKLKFSEGGGLDVTEVGNHRALPTLVTKATFIYSA